MWIRRRCDARLIFALYPLPLSPPCGGAPSWEVPQIWQAQAVVSKEGVEECKAAVAPPLNLAQMYETNDGV